MSKIYTLVINTREDDFYPVFSSASKEAFNRAITYFQSSKYIKGEKWCFISIEKLLAYLKRRKIGVEELIVNNGYPEDPDWDVISLPFSEEDGYCRNIKSIVSYFEKELQNGYKDAVGLVFTSINIKEV